jgi:hypothetical protein
VERSPWRVSRIGVDGGNVREDGATELFGGQRSMMAVDNDALASCSVSHAQKLARRAIA